MSKNAKKLVPKLRFPEFQNEGAWQQVRLDEIADRVSLKNKDGKVIRVLTNSAANGIVDQRDYFEKDIAVQGNLDGYYVVENGDYIYNPRVSNLAPVGPISKNKLGTGVMSPLYSVFRFKNSDNSFYEQYFKTHNWHHYLRTISNSGARHDRMAITTTDFMGMPLPVPAPKEQQKIADCLSSIDDLITAQSQKIEALKIHKKGLMQQLFPREGETVPRLRFPEFRDAGEWVEKTLKDICKMQAGKFVRAADIFDEQNRGLYPCYGGNGQRGFTKSFTHEGKYSLIGRQGALCGNITLANGKFHATEHAVVVSPNNDVNTDWLFYMLGFMNLNQHATGQAQPGLSVENLEKLPIAISTVGKEQQKIASCLSSIDDLITLQAQKLESLKNHKKGLMQQLFPAAGDTDE